MNLLNSDDAHKLQSLLVEKSKKTENWVFLLYMNTNYLILFKKLKLGVLIRKEY